MKTQFRESKFVSLFLAEMEALNVATAKSKNISLRGNEQPHKKQISRFETKSSLILKQHGSLSFKLKRVHICSWAQPRRSSSFFFKKLYKARFFWFFSERKSKINFAKLLTKKSKNLIKKNFGIFGFELYFLLVKFGECAHNFKWK